MNFKRPIATEIHDWTEKKFVAAQEAFAEAERTWNERVGREGNISLALQIADAGDGGSRAPQHLKERAAIFSTLAADRPEQLRAELHALRREITEAQPAWIAARAEWERALRQETDRRAREMQPRHRAIARRMADAVETLSAALEDEMALRRTVGPLPASRYLPDISSVLEVGSLEQFGSRLWQWRVRINELGVLK